MGLVFAYGHTLDGALGLGDEISDYVALPTLVDYFFDNLIVVLDIACGGDQLVGAHSAAVSQAGEIFTWGVGIALGRGTMRSASTPQRVELPPMETDQENFPSTMPSSTVASSVSCGSGFCVALTCAGHGFSWGKWSDGRLGLGRIPIIARTSRRHSGGSVRKQLQSFQLTPKKIQHVYTNAVNALYGGVKQDALFSKVSCGDAHCVGLTTTGGLVTWGRGNNGQQGRGDVKDTLVPTTVFIVNSEQKHWRDVAAGENWTMALSRDGQVWSWGACGGAVLGHGLQGSQKNALLAETILQRHQRLVSQRSKSSLYSGTRVPRLKWMEPQVIPCFSTPGIRICRISAGAQHAAAISATGDLYMWGAGSPECDGDASDSEELLLSGLPKLVNCGQREKRRMQNNDNIGKLCVEHVVCGGHQAIVFTSGSFLARSLSKLYRDSIEHEKLGRIALADADLVLVVSGHRLLAHKLLLAQRSPILRELILEEEQQQNMRFTVNEESELTIPITDPMELLLPRLRVDVARAIVEFIYTDSFTVEANTSSYYLVNDVLRAAQLYKLPSLIRLCRERLFSLSPSSRFEADAPSALLLEINEEYWDTSTKEDASIGNNTEDTRMLNDDMRFALSDDVWADTVLIAEGRKIPVHRCMLIARSEYFRVVLAFHRSAARSLPHDSKISVVNVEGSYAGIARVLRFIYYDQVALPSLKRVGNKCDNCTLKKDDDGEIKHDYDGDASDQLLEDLVAADKYGLERMKRLCEHAVCVTVANCLEVLAVAELVHATHLKQVAMRFVQTHLGDVTSHPEEFRRFQEEFPQLLEELYTNLRDACNDEFLLREWYTEVESSIASQRENQELLWGKKATSATFPWVPLSLTVAFGSMYLSMMNTQEYEYSAVPATNVVAIVAIGGAIMMGYL
ncbi:Transmembrane protein [Phytophthora megakarya]|uniref:Transmembrane protein n=1 Tax=Phytophthora megakarya TaxID=4795 RepID=A0A225WSN7_9STRA|nr:Transmembrane protein [Phytophthora megakarya]